MASSVSIILEGVDVEAHVGLHPWERFPEKPTRLKIDLTISFAFDRYFGELGGFVDYDGVRRFLLSLRDQPHTDHLETIARQVLDHVFKNAGAARASLTILKPDIFNEADAVGVSFDVTREDYLAS
ncbi:MAG: hypothetical protein GC206_11735 [Alphaproteobacteria bacterium]|nr:hypothetical protein [Alphaproteobacteria bacterium]